MSTPADEPRSSKPPVPPSGRRRDKAQLSCMLCRHRKLRCDRSQPCQNCAKRGQSCVYVHSSGNTKSTHTSRQYPGYLNSLQDRIHHLESVVLSLVNNKSPNAARSSVSAHVRDQPQIIDSVGRLSIEDNGTSYLGSSTWQAILDEIGSMKDLIPDNTNSPFTDRTEESDEEGLDLLMGTRKQIDTRDLFDAVPPQSVVRPLLYHYFESMDMSPLIIHSPTFWKEYEIFCNNSATASIMWLSMLFAMLSLASNFHLLTGDTPDSDEILKEDVRNFRQRSAQCLIAADYTKPGKYNLSALILYLTCERMRREEFDTSIPMAFSMVVSLAMRMGYHRDASHYPNLTPFAGEMRRRLWCMIVQLDLLVSIGVGLPRMINDYQADNAPPRNLREEDFGEDSVELPPPRPSAEPTMVTYVASRTKVITIFGKITDLVNTTIHPPYETVMEFDHELNKVYEQLPTFYKLREGPKTDEPMALLHRLSFESLYEQARCTLHRRYLTIPDIRYSYSRKVCVDAAMRMITQQLQLHEECQPGRILHSQRWKVQAFLNREYLLATMIVCLDLDNSLKNADSPDPASVPPGDQAVSLERKIEILEQSQALWERYRAISKEATTAAAVLEVMIRKAKNMSTPPDTVERSVMSSTTSPVQHVLEEQYSTSLMDYPVPATPYMMGAAPHGTEEGLQYHNVMNGIGSSSMPPQSQQQPQPQPQLPFQYDASAMYQAPPPPPMMAQEASPASMESMGTMTTEISPNSAYKMMETMLDKPVHIGWGALWDAQLPRDFTAAPAILPTTENVWDYHPNAGFPAPPAGPPLGPNGGLGYQG